MIALYSILVSIVVRGILVPWHLLLIIIGRFTREELNQRGGRGMLPERKKAIRILIHAVSAGEMTAAEPLVRELLGQGGSDFEFILTTGNRDGMRSAISLQKRYPEIVFVQFLPWDGKTAILSWLHRLRPDLVAVVETELWPNLFASCGALHIPLCLINARIYRDDVQRYRMLPSFFRNVLQDVSWIGVQNSREREQFLAIGATPEHIDVVGNLKFDVSVSSDSLPDECQKRLEHISLLIVGGSTHSPEEQWLIQSFADLKPSFPGLRLLLAPRHTTRAGELERLVRNQGLVPARWSTHPDNSWDVLLLDELGWLSRVYGHADIAVVGGSFINHGGHNILEPAAQQCAIVTGPHMQHFQEIVNEFRGAGAIVQLTTHQELTTSLRYLLEDRARRVSLARNAHAVLESRRGAARIYATTLQHMLQGKRQQLISHVC